MKKILSIALFAITLSVQAEPNSVGTQLSSFSLQDQFDVKQTVDENTRLILFARDMDGNAVLKEAMTDKSADYLSQKKAAYVTDISGMPRVIAFLFGKPKMRKYPYPMLLDAEPMETKDFPAHEGEATLIQLDHLKIKSIQFTKKTEDVVKALDALQ